ncbi:MAG TPA: hypothetical protein VK973_02290 [Arenicellales bacterium]|nr:hypothetical protein [Arenicellales bacterium]
MTRRSRRRLLKGLALTLPAAWSRPIVESVVLPAHAQTSVPGCSADPGCYVYNIGDSDESFNWPGGAGPETVELFAGSGCSDTFDETATVVVAASLAEAQAAVSCPGSSILIEIATTPPAPEGCSFYMCVVFN